METNKRFRILFATFIFAVLFSFNVSHSKNVKTDVVFVEVQAGELVDKITILEIKSERIKDPAKLKNIRFELSTLMETYNKFPQSKELGKLKNDLKKRNEALWEIEDDIRNKEVIGKKEGFFKNIENLHRMTTDKLVEIKEFINGFIGVARSVYYANDERCEVKREINKLLGSRLVEEKSYSDYKA